MLTITLGVQLINLSPFIYFIVWTNRLCQYKGYSSVHPWQFMFPALCQPTLVLSHSVTDYGLSPSTIIYLFRWLMVSTLPSRGIPLLDKVEKLTQTAIRRDSNTHMETFGDHSDIFYTEFSFHMKHLGYFSPTMNSYMVSLKYDFEEFRSKH